MNFQIFAAFLIRTKTNAFLMNVIEVSIEKEQVLKQTGKKYDEGQYNRKIDSVSKNIPVFIQKK